MSARVLAIVPSYNEEASLPSTLSELRAVRPDIDVLVVDDGSRDGSIDVTRAQGCRVICLPVNLGVGGAVQTGLHYALRHGYDVAFQYDADGQHRPDQIQRLIAPILRGEADIVLGSRFIHDSGYRVSVPRGSMMWLLKTLSSIATGRRITDSTSGFRAYGRECIAYMAAHCSCDYPEFESMIRLVRSGYRYTEVPSLMRRRVAGRSMFTPFRAVYYIVRSLMAVVLSILDTPREKCERRPDRMQVR